MNTDRSIGEITEGKSRKEKEDKGRREKRTAPTPLTNWRVGKATAPPS